MTEDEFIQHWEAEQPIYKAWGQHVALAIVDALAPQIAPISVDVYLRLPPKPRLKSNISFLEKAFYRKHYDDPYGDVTDKVGVRFVVLLPSQIRVVEAALLACKGWSHSKDKDFEEEQDKAPMEFQYAAVHYVVRPETDVVLGPIRVPAGIPCEVQVKTILQHAYSEITHDTIYKPKVDATPAMKRAAAKSMALIEATSDYFEDVVREVAKLVEPSRALTNDMQRLYEEHVGRTPEISRTEGLLVAAYEPQLAPDATERIQAFLKAKEYIGTSIADKAKSKLLFRQPSVLAVYWMANERPNDTRSSWPLTADELRPIYVDLGIKFD